MAEKLTKEELEALEAVLMHDKKYTKKLLNWINNFEAGCDERPVFLLK